MKKQKIKDHLKKETSDRGLIYYSFKKNHQKRSINFDLILDEISSPVKISNKASAKK